jgi:NAD(P)H-nitrite reductase large subunit
VAEACGAGTSCGGCVPLVCELVETELKKCGEQPGELGTLLRAS